MESQWNTMNASNLMGLYTGGGGGLYGFLYMEYWERY